MILKRIFAYLIDYLIIMLYAGALFLISYLVHTINGSALEVMDPITGNIISFLTLTLPAFLYFYYFESSKKQGTFGKQLLKIKVQNNSNRNILVRVSMKILPWELAHFAIHFSVYYQSQSIEIPLWNSILMIVSQIIVLIYFISVLTTRGKSSLHDWLARTSVDFK